MIAVAAQDAAHMTAAQSLSDRLKLPLSVLDAPDWPFLLVASAQGLQIRQQGKGAPGPVAVHFTGGKADHRRRFGGGRGQPLARAVGLKQGRTPRVLDATAGLGRDAFVLATLGCEVVMVERSPLVAALLRDGLQRASNDTQVGAIAARMSLHQGDAVDYLRQLSNRALPDVVYLDPMYPRRRKRAAVKKEMRLFQQLVGADADSALLLDAARQRVRRVVVKRPASGSWLGEARPNATVSSPNTRYDIYLRAPGGG